MFTKEVVGTANALVGGWGNLGASVTNLIIGSFLFPVFKVIYNGNAELAWRTVSIVPAIVAFITGIVVYHISDDAPKGNYTEMKRNKAMLDVKGIESFKQACFDLNTWLLFIQYACCFGVELTMNNAAALYFKVRVCSLRVLCFQKRCLQVVVSLEKCTSVIEVDALITDCGVLFFFISRSQDVFGQSTESAGAIASIFGWMNLFARGLGGVFSDGLNETMGMRGRLIAQTLLLLGEGISVIVFAHTTTLAGAVCVLVLFSLFVQAAEGSSYGIVPYVNPRYMGSVCGIVGAGGNVGAVVFGLCFRELDYESAFVIMGCSILVSAVLSAFIYINGHAGMFTGEDYVVDQETGAILEFMDDYNDHDNEAGGGDVTKGRKAHSHHGTTSTTASFI